MASRGVGVGAVLDELERHGAIGFGILRQIDVGHAAAAELAEDLVLAEFAAGGGDHFLLPPRTRRFHVDHKIVFANGVEQCRAADRACSSRRRCRSAPASRHRARLGRAFDALKCVVRNQRRGCADDQDAFGTAIVDGVAAQAWGWRRREFRCRRWRLRYRRRPLRRWNYPAGCRWRAASCASP